MFIVSLLSLQNVCDYDSVYVLSFCSCINLDQSHKDIQASNLKEGCNQLQEGGTRVMNVPL